MALPKQTLTKLAAARTIVDDVRASAARTPDQQWVATKLLQAREFLDVVTKDLETPKKETARRLPAMAGEAGDPVTAGEAGN